MATSDLSVRFLLLDQLTYLSRLGYDVHATSSPGVWVRDVEARGIPFHPARLTRRLDPLTDIFGFADLVKVFRRLKPDVVHTHTPKASLLAQYAAVVGGVPTRVHTIHGLYTPHTRNRVRAWAYLALERAIMMPATAILSQSAEDVETCKTLRLCDPSRLSFLGNGIDVTRFRPPSVEEAAAVRSELGLGADAKVIGMIGRLVREKGYVELFEAAASIIKRIPNVVILVIGPDEPDKADALTPGDIARFALGDHVRTLGMRTDIDRLLWAMDVLAFPSHREGFPRTPMEASAAGVPVIAANVRGSREAVVSGVNGDLVPVGDAAALAEALLGLLADEERRAVLARQAREHAVAHFDQTSVFERVDATYRRLREKR